VLTGWVPVGWAAVAGLVAALSVVALTAGERPRSCRWCRPWNCWWSPCWDSLRGRHGRVPYRVRVRVGVAGVGVVHRRHRRSNAIHRAARPGGGAGACVAHAGVPAGHPTDQPRVGLRRADPGRLPPRRGLPSRCRTPIRCCGCSPTGVYRSSRSYAWSPPPAGSPPSARPT